MSQTDLEIISKIAGDVVINNNPGQMLKIWRQRLKIKQIILAKQMNMSPSVLSDYESGRRSSPGVIFIKKYIKALVEVDKTNNKTSAPSAPTLPGTRGVGSGACVPDYCEQQH